MSEFVFGQADRRLIDLVADVTLVLPDVRTVLRVGFHVVFQLRSRLAVLVAVRTVQTHLAKTSRHKIQHVTIDRSLRFFRFAVQKVFYTGKSRFSLQLLSK